MNNLRKLLAALCLFIAGGLLPATAMAFDNRVDAQLISETDRLSPGGSSKIALKLSPQSGWHVYWSNPGDSGMPPRITWTLPPNVRVGQLRHPAPVAKDAAGFVSYVHPGDVSLLADIHIPSSMPAGTPLTLIANVQWLSCSDNMCVPEKARLTLDLAVGTGIGSRSTGEFNAFEAALPRRLTQPGTMRVVGDAIEFEFNNAIIDAASARLYPDDPAFDASAEQIVRREGGKLIFTISSKKPLPASFSGVITARGAARGFSVSAKPQQAASPQIATRPVEEASTPKLSHADVPGAQPANLSLDALKGPEARILPSPARASESPAAIADASSGFLPAFLGAIIGGLLLNLMPCVFPILSLKALSLVRSGASERAARLEALSYTTGAVVACTALGAGLLGFRAAGSEIGWAFQLQNPYIILLLAALMAVISFNLLGLFELPSVSVGGGLMMRDGAAGAFWTGTLTAIIATPCSGPFMGLAIGAALVLPVPAALAVFFGLGLGLAMPFLAIGLIPALRAKLPRPGAWMVRLRQFLAIPMLLTTAALIWILGRQTGTTGMMVGAFVFVTSAALLTWAGRRQLAQSSLWAPLGALSVMIVAAAAMLPAPQARAQIEASDFKKPFSSAALAELRSRNIPVFVDFTADWCLTCKVNEKVGIGTDVTQKALKDGGVVTLVGDWTNSDPAISRFLAQHGRNSIPFYLYYAPGKPPVVLPQILGPNTLSEAVKG